MKLYCPSCRRYHGGPVHIDFGRFERMRQMYTEIRAIAPPLPLACGDCEHQPCRCTAPDDLDLAWLPRLADHDLIP